MICVKWAYQSRNALEHRIALDTEYSFEISTSAELEPFVKQIVKLALEQEPISVTSIAYFCPHSEFW